MPNRNGNAYGLTALFPVKDGAIEDITYQERLRAYLADLPRDSKSPFARKPITHFSRFVVIDKFGFNGEPSVPDPLVSPWLLWTACFNGDLDTWLDDIWHSMRGELKVIFLHCVGYGCDADKHSFVRFVKRGQVTTSFLFADYPNATLEEVLDGLKLKKHFVSFMADNQAADAETLKSNFSAWMDEMAREPQPNPGTAF